MSARKRVVKIIQTRADNSEVFEEITLDDFIADDLWKMLQSFNNYEIIDDPELNIDYGAITLRVLWMWEQLHRPIELKVRQLQNELIAEELKGNIKGRNEQF